MRLAYRRHHNGGGKLYNDAFVSQDSFVDRASAVFGEKSNITSSRLQCSVISDCVIHRARMSAVNLVGGVVDGDVQLIGPWDLCGPFYIRHGIWRRAPRNKVIAHESAIYVGVTESTEGRVFIGCNERPITDWLRFGLKVGKWLSWPDDVAIQAGKGLCASESEAR